MKSSQNKKKKFVRSSQNKKKKCVTLSRIRKRKSMEPRVAAQLEAEKAYAHFIAWSKTAFYCILAFLIILAFFNFGTDGTGSQYNGEVYAPINVG